MRCAGNSLWSIDVDAEGKRVATGGGDSRVRIWALAPLLHARAEVDDKMPKLLATLTDFMGSVNVVRFSPKGNLLASGSDDNTVSVHTLQPGPGKALFGSKDAPSLENWRQVHSMRGHTLNVADLAWCPDGSKLASASLDNLVVIWDAATGRQLAVLSGHHGCVKGVAWDPFNHYVASQGDQDGIAIWRTSDWQLETRVQVRSCLSVCLSVCLSSYALSQYLPVDIVLRLTLGAN
jgi:protein HIRA/HIR1